MLLCLTLSWHLYSVSSHFHHNQNQFRLRESAIESSEVEQESDSWETIIPILVEDQVDGTDSQWKHHNWPSVEESEMSTSSSELTNVPLTNPPEASRVEAATTTATGTSQCVYPTRDRRPPDRFRRNST